MLLTVEPRGLKPRVRLYSGLIPTYEAIWI